MYLEEQAETKKVYSINEGDMVKEGSFLFTVIDNHSPLKIAAYLTRKEYEYFMRNYTASFRLQIEGLNLTAEMISEKRYEEGFFVKFRINRAPDRLYLKDRRINTVIIIEREEIFQVPARALVMKKGEYYIYLLKDERFELQKVELIKTEEGLAFIADIPEGRVLINPHFVELGEELPFL